MTLAGKQRVAVVQMVSGADLEANLEQAETLLKSAARQGAKLALLPENFALFDTPRLRALAEAEELGHKLERWISAQANSLDMIIAAGTVPAAKRADGTTIPDGRVRSRLLVLDELGNQVASYDKRHLFDVDVGDAQGSYRESNSFEPGDDPEIAQTSVGTLGLSICYDLRFAPHYRRLREMGAEILLAPAAFTRPTGEAHWELLLRARAVEQQCFMLGGGSRGRALSQPQNLGALHDNLPLGRNTGAVW